jgi:hypothetical protein
VVIFVNRNDTLHPIMTRVKQDTSLRAASTGIKGMDLSANIQVSKDATLGIIVDPASGDSLQVKGDAALNFAIDASGKTSLTGRYEVSEGSYHLSFYDFIKRKFLLKEGSIVWSGDPLTAEVDLTAVYEVRTSPIDLVEDQLASLDQQEKNSYQEVLPFQMYMYMKKSCFTRRSLFRLIYLPTNVAHSTDLFMPS